MLLNLCLLTFILTPSGWPYFITLIPVHSIISYGNINFVFGWPCISNYMDNNQLDALFIFSLVSYHTSTCFRHISSSSVLVIFLRLLSAGLFCRSITSTFCQIYTHYLLALPSLTGGGRSVGIVRSRTEAMEFISWWWAADMPETCRGAITQ
jgi:hypothetical protein